MKPLLRVDRAIAALETTLVVLLLGVMLLLGFTQVILRNFFSTGFPWADIFLRQMVLWVAFLGATLAVRDRKHISIDVLTRLLPVRGGRYSRLITDFFAAVVCFIFLRASVTFVGNEMAQGTNLILEIPTWYFQSIIPVAYTLICFRFIIKLLEGLEGLKSDRKNSKGKT